MKILFISKDLVAGDLAYRLTKEGHDVKLFIERKECKESFDNLITKSVKWKSDLTWVGKEGLIIFDDTGYGKTQDTLRKKGYTVLGGSLAGEMIEIDREYGQKIFKEVGIRTQTLKDFDSIEDAIIYAKQNPRPWVIKQNGEDTKMLGYVSQFDDGHDAIDVMKNYLQNKALKRRGVTLHERVVGVEIAAGRFFNGTNWVGPIYVNVEHPRFFPGDVGPMTSEMGTLGWCTKDESLPLYQKTLARMTSKLREANYRGYFDINCIANETGIYALEATCRFGSPMTHLQSALHNDKWGDFLFSVASGSNADIKYKDGYSIVVTVAVPPFPYTREIKGQLFQGLNIYTEKLTSSEMHQLHFEGVALRTGTENQLFISNNDGFILYATGSGTTIKEAQDSAYSVASKIVLPKAMYRNDIGSKFDTEDQEKLHRWGIL